MYLFIGLCLFSCYFSLLSLVWFHSTVSQWFDSTRNPGLFFTLKSYLFLWGVEFSKISKPQNEMAKKLDRICLHRILLLRYLTEYVYIGYFSSDISGQIPIVLRRLDWTEILFCIRRNERMKTERVTYTISYWLNLDSSCPICSNKKTSVMKRKWQMIQVMNTIHAKYSPKYRL